MRIVSLLPSATEFICALGLRDQLVGVSHECDYPASVVGLPVVTSTRIDHTAPSRNIDDQVRRELELKQGLYALRRQVLEDLTPDLIVTQSLCDVCAVAEAEVNAVCHTLSPAPQVFNLQPMNLGDILETPLKLGDAALAPAAGTRLQRSMNDRIEAVRARSARIAPSARPRVIFLEWLDPPFNAGHWTPELIDIAGGEPILAAAGQPSTTISWPRVCESRADHLIVGCCGFDVGRSRRELERLLADPTHPARTWLEGATISLVNGNAYFNRPGPRLVDSLEVVAHALHPDVHPLPGEAERATTFRLPPDK